MLKAILFCALPCSTLLAQHLIVLNKEDNTLAIVDPVAKKVLGRVPTGEGPHEVAVSSDGRLAFVGNYGGRTPGNSLSVIDLDAQKELHRVDLKYLRRPHGIAFFDNKAYFTVEGNQLLARYDPSTNEVDWLMGTGQVGTHMVCINKATGSMYTANIGSDSITFFERAGPGLRSTVVQVGKGPEGIDLSPDGKELWAAHSGDGGVSIIDTASKKVTQTLPLGTKRSNRLKFTPDGSRVLISDINAGEIVVLDAATRKEIKRVKMGRAPEGILMRPDGAVAYVGVAADNHIAILDLKTLEVTGTVETGNGPDGMAWVAAK